MMMLFQSEQDSSVLELLDQSVVSRRRAPLQKQERKGFDGSSPFVSLMFKSVLSDGREDQLLRE